MIFYTYRLPTFSLEMRTLLCFRDGTPETEVSDDSGDKGPSDTVMLSSDGPGSETLPAAGVDSGTFVFNVPLGFPSGRSSNSVPEES